MSGVEPKIFEHEKCYEPKCNEACKYCYVNAKKSLYSRKCFMTGEYCSKQSSIQSEREELHKENKINAFVIMSFSNMADIVYESRIKRFIKKLKKYLAFDEKKDRICCSREKIKDEENGSQKIKYHAIKEIIVERGDSEVASNYVMCSRICQRIQIADLIIVDVSHQNPNVFYELGMAIALGKMILPICFSESYYKMSVPELVKETDKEYEEIEHHMGCYPWRKDLFEYFGMFQTKDEEGGKKKTRYLEYKVIESPKYQFSHMQYNRFPYDAQITKMIKNPDGTLTEKSDGKKIGEQLYEELKNNYNSVKKSDNTLLVYTMDGFLNEEDAGDCIVNFYHTITAKLQEEQCFCGDRVGVLVQGNGIPEEDKDSDKQIDLFYSIGDIIQIGVNQATYLAEEERLKTDDVMAARKFNTDEEVITKKQGNGILRAVKGYMRNRGITVNIKNPVHVKRELDKLKYGDKDKILEEKNILEESKVCSCGNSKINCLYHKVLHSLRYVNEVVVDISNNSIYSLFWLGIAHGSSVNAIVVLHDATEKEREIMTGNKDKKYRIVFDVVGLWTAILHSDDTQGFYNQLALAQHGIENHQKLILKNKSFYEKRLRDKWREIGKEFVQTDIKEIYNDEKTDIKHKLESYYRSRFWNAMLRHNQLLICMPQIEQVESFTEEPRGYTSKWDFRASAIISHYLSKRTVISEYSIKAITGKKEIENISQRNFISLGSAAKPLAKTLAEYIAENEECKEMIHKHYDKDYACGREKVNKKERLYKGFGKMFMESNIDGYYTQHPQIMCSEKCCGDFPLPAQEKDIILYNTSKLNDCICKLCKRSEHFEIAQLIMWRESSFNHHEKTVFRVAVNGSSGPATLGLSSILVGDAQKKDVFGTDNTKNFLYDLQEELRKLFMERYKDRLDKKIKDILPYSECEGEDEDKYKYKKGQVERYIGLVWYAVSIYLYNELYRYFLPLLSDKDIYSLSNGMYNFVNYMRIEKESPFDINYPENEDDDYSTAIAASDVTKIIKEIPSQLSALLKEFRGLEAFYKVKVRHKPFDNEEKEKEDTRDVIDIEMLTDSENNHYINCFW